MEPNTAQSADSLNQITERLSSANNVLITVSKDPSVDQLAACIGLTLALNKHGKHATAVFSGKIPSTLEFLQPEKTIEVNTNSLRDFIVSLDKSKADKLRYKVEDEFVKIFITPYRTSLDENDLTFTQGDFNIDLIITLGVKERTDLDGAIVAHGRILHDATVASLSTDVVSEVGTLNWVDSNASSLCEMATDLVNEVDKNIFDAQIATALLTGMVAETDRFGNEKATPHTMSVSGVLMAAGASTQLISSKLEEVKQPEESIPDELPEVVADIPSSDSESESIEDNEEEVKEEEAPKPQDGVIEIDHSTDDISIDEQGRLQAIKDLEAAQAELKAQEEAAASQPEPAAAPQPPTDTLSEESSRQYLSGQESSQGHPEDESASQNEDSKLVLDPPKLGGQLTANSVPEHRQYSPSVDPMNGDRTDAPILDRSSTNEAKPDVSQPDTPDQEPKEQTLSDLERAVGSHHVQEAEEQNSSESTIAEQPVATNDPVEQLEDARMAVEQAALTSDYKPEPLNSVGSSPVDLNLARQEDQPVVASSQSTIRSTTPPPVPPPMMPPSSN